MTELLREYDILHKRQIFLKKKRPKKPAQKAINLNSKSAVPVLQVFYFNKVSDNKLNHDLDTRQSSQIRWRNPALPLR